MTAPAPAPAPAREPGRGRASAGAGRATVVDRREHVSFVAGPFARRTWREFGYLWCALLLLPFGFAYAVFTVSFTAGIAVTVLGLFVGAWLIRGGRAWGGLYRSMAAAMLATDVAAPHPVRSGGGFWARVRSGLLDGVGWRALAFLVVSLPVALAGFVVSVVFLVVPLGTFTHWYWYRFLPLQRADDGTWHRGASVASVAHAR